MKLVMIWVKWHSSANSLVFCGLIGSLSFTTPNAYFTIFVNRKRQTKTMEQCCNTRITELFHSSPLVKKYFG